MTVKIDISHALIVEERIKGSSDGPISRPPCAGPPGGAIFLEGRIKAAVRPQMAGGYSVSHRLGCGDLRVTWFGPIREQ